jgi:hypothetical protein
MEENEKITKIIDMWKHPKKLKQGLIDISDKSMYPVPKVLSKMETDHGTAVV